MKGQLLHCTQPSRPPWWDTELFPARCLQAAFWEEPAVGLWRPFLVRAQGCEALGTLYDVWPVVTSRLRGAAPAAAGPDALQAGG